MRVYAQVSTNIDGALDVPRLIEVRAAVLPRDIFDGPPDWFTKAIAQAFDDGTWEDLDDCPSREELLASHSEEFVEKHKDTSTEQLFEMSRAPYCTQFEEAAIVTFMNLVSANHLFDHMGWVEMHGQDVLVSESYSGNAKDFQSLKDICESYGWEFRVTGVSGYLPSHAIRIEIGPAGGQYGVA